MVGIQILKFSAALYWTRLNRYEVDLNLYSFTIPYGQSTVGVGKKVAPSRVLGKTKPIKWFKYYKVGNFISELSFRNVDEGFRIKLFKNALCLGRKVLTSIMHVKQFKHWYYS